MITDVPFWMKGAGHITRISSLVDFLIKHTCLTVIILNKDYESTYIPRYDNLNAIFLCNDNADDKSCNPILVKKLFDFDYYNLCIIEYINYSYFLKFIPKGVITILDTHDIISERNNAFHSYGYKDDVYTLSKQQEYKIYRLYNYVIFISKTDYERSKKLLPEEKMFLAPHPLVVNHIRLRDDAKIVGFIGSDYLPNIDAILWFLEHVWPKIPIELELEIHIYGLICRKLPPQYCSLKGVKLKGFAMDINEVYKQVDIIINPVRFGAGLKIKNVEAMSYGIPLLTTSHGASGLEDAVETAFLVADKANDFREKLLNLAHNKELRKKLSNMSKKWIKNNLNEEICFASIKKLLYR